MKLWRLIGLACAVHAAAAFAASPQSQAMSSERFMRPPAAVLVAGVEGSARPDAPPDPCANAGTQAALGECAYEGFLQASAAMSSQLRQVESALTPGQRTTWRRVQKAWLTYRTQACHFESSQLGSGSARAMVQWQCSARMTRERSAELARMAACREGDLACPVRSRPTRMPWNKS